MTEVQELAEFVERARLPDLSEEAAEQLKIRVLDTVGVAIAALAGPPIVAIRELIAELGGRPLATLIGGGKTAPDRAAFFNGALVAISILWTATSLQARPVILPTMSALFWPLLKCAMPAGRISWWRWPWPIRCKRG